MRRAGVDLFDDTDDLFQFLHQFGAVLQSAGGSIRSTSMPRLSPRAPHRRRAPPRRRPASRAMKSAPLRVGPDLQLLDRGGAERVAGRQHHRSAFGAEFGRQFADGRGLARAIDAGDQDDEWLLRRSMTSGCATCANAFSTSSATTALTSSGVIAASMTALAQRVRDPVRGADAEIGSNQRIVDFLDRRLVEHALGDEIGDRGQRRRAALEAAGEAPPPRLLGFGGFAGAVG